MTKFIIYDHSIAYYIPTLELSKRIKGGYWIFQENVIK
jgi:hypothetical protein